MVGRFTHAKRWAAMALLALCFAAAVLASQTAMAQTTAPTTTGTSGSTPQGDTPVSNPQTSDGQGGTKDCKSYPEAAGGTLLGIIVPCLEHTIEDSTANFSQQLITMLEPLLWIYITLVIVFFGVKVVEGKAGPLKKQAFILIFKLSMVVGILQIMSTTIVPAAFSSMQEAQAIVATAIDTTTISCPIANYGDSNTPLMWKQMDCVLGKLFGIAIGNRSDGTKGPNVLLMSSVFGMLGGFMFGGTFGVAVFMACIGVIISALMLVLRTAVAFINAYFHVSILLILSPVFLPMTLMEATNDYFKRWSTSILGAMLMPVVVAAYVNFALLLYDKVLFEPNSVFNQIFSVDFANAIEAMPKKPCDVQVTGDPGMRSKLEGVSAADLYKGGLFKNEIFPFLTGANSPCSAVNLPSLDVSKIKDANGNPYKTSQDWFTAMFKDAIKLFVTTLLINAGFATAMKSALIFVGSYSAYGSSGGQQIDQFDERLRGGVSGGLSKAFKKRVDANGKDVAADKPGHMVDTSGSEFVSRLPAVPGNLISGFIDGIKG